MQQGLIDDKSTLVQVMAGAVRQQAITWTSVDQELQRHMASLGLNELTRDTSAIWQGKTGSAMFQVMACGPTAPNHYLDQ